MNDLKNENCMHTATCGELRQENVGSEVVLQVYGAEQTTTEPESTTKPETTVQEVQ